MQIIYINLNMCQSNLVKDGITSYVLARWQYNLQWHVLAAVFDPKISPSPGDLTLCVYEPAKMTSKSVKWFEQGAWMRVTLQSCNVTCRTCNPEVTQRCRFDSASGHCRVTTLGKLFTHMCLCHKLVLASPLGRNQAHRAIHWP